jgi:transcriptional regulator GlxA family with amidase domain
MRRSVKHVWFLVVPGSELLDIAGPWEVLGHANDLLGRTAYAMQLVGPHTPEIRTLHGLTVGAVRPLPRSVRKPPDVVVVAGGSPFDPLPEPEERLVSWMRRHHARIPTVVSICTGAFILGAAGVLDRRRATTHWQLLGDLKSRFPAARVADDGIFVRDGKVWTSAGITAGIDLALALVEDDHGHSLAMEVAKKLVLFLRRSGSQAQFSSSLQRQAKEPSKLRNISAFVLEHLDEPLPVERIAAHSGMSLRSLGRWCREHLQESPAELVRRLRIEEAQRLLEETGLPLKDITARTGLGDASTMWRAFTRRLGITPAEYRQRFCATGPGSRG